MAQTKKAKANKPIEKAVELTQDTAKAALSATIQTAELTESYAEGLYKVGYDANVDALKVAKNYWDAASQIRQDWISLFAATGEHLIDATAKIEFPFQEQVGDLGKAVIQNVEKTFESLTTRVKPAAK